MTCKVPNNSPIFSSLSIEDRFVNFAVGPRRVTSAIRPLICVLTLSSLLGSKSPLSTTAVTFRGGTPTSDRQLGQVRWFVLSNYFIRPLLETVPVEPVAPAESDQKFSYQVTPLTNAADVAC